MISKEQILKLCTEVLTESQFIVDVKVSRNNDILVYVDDINGIPISDCKQISRHIESQLDRELEDYALEVGSPGLSNPFKVIQQYYKYLNKEVEVLMVDGEKFVGSLDEVNEEFIIIGNTVTKKIENKKQKIKEQVKISFKDIKSTKSIISFK